MEAILKKIESQLIQQNEAIRNLNSKVDSALQSFDVLSVKLESVVNQLPDGITVATEIAPPAKARDSQKRRRSLMELPAELQTEIFVRLPVRSILLCKCVCKPFNNLIKNPSFIQTHVNRLSPISDDTQSLIFHFGGIDEDPYCQYQHFLVTIENNSNSKVPLSALPLTPPIERVGEFDQYYVVGSCNGLICLAVLYQEYEEPLHDWLYFLWNPVLKQCRRLPQPLRSDDDPVVIEFAFLPETNDYVIVKLNCGHAEVYKMSKNLWVEIDSKIYGGGGAPVGGNKSTIGRDENVVFLNGAFHWTCEQDGRNYIVYYNLKDEKIRLMKGLDDDRALITDEVNNDFTSHKRRKLAVINELLAMMYWIEDLSNKLEVWVMNEYGVEDSWAIRFQIVHDISRYLNPLGYWTNGNLMIIEDDSGRHLYDLNTRKRNKFPRMGSFYIITGFCCYVETLLPVR